ncbi:MAG: TonB family protein [Deltaproteobacteria bacterium]|nr:TonB family protein [Deltaproteobacteria bacterium]MBW2413718.1 TonB family protein [Deltaproteobacteria bacterium]
MSPVPLWASDAFRRWIGYSAAAHAVAMIVIAVGPGVSSAPPPPPIFVDLVAAPPQPKARRSQPAKRRQVVDEAVVIPKQPKASRSKPKPKPEQAPAKAEEKAPSAADILAQLRTKVASRTARTSGTLQGREGRPEDPELAAYKARVMSCLYEHWAGARAFSRSPELEVQFQVKITATGGVRSVSMTRSSSNRYLDESAERAVWKCEPFDAPPNGVSQLNLTFNPADLV